MSSPDEIVDYLVENVALFGPGGEYRAMNETVATLSVNFFTEK